MAQQVFDQVPFKEHTANGLTTVFAFDFQVLEAGDLVVYRDGVVAPTSDYSLAGLGVAAGGTVTFSVAPANGVTVLLSREISLQRMTEYQTLGDFKAVTVNPDFNRLWMAIQGVNAKLGGVLRLPFPEQADELPGPSERANRILAGDATGKIVPIVGVDSDSASALDLSLRDTTDDANGAGQIGESFARNYVAGSLGYALHVHGLVVQPGGDISAAVNVLPASGGVIRLATGTYTSPYQATATTATVAAMMTKKNISIIGSGMPEYNATNTALVGGTIILGSFFAMADGFQLLNLGIDSGSDFCTTYKAGVPQEGFNAFDVEQLGQPAQATVHSLKIDNVRILCHQPGTAALPSDVHACLVENYEGFDIGFLETRLGGAGLVLKSSNGIVRRHIGRGHFKYGGLIKSESYKVAKQIQWAHAEYRSLVVSTPDYLTATDYDTSGLIIQASTADATDIQIGQIITDGVIQPFMAQGLSTYQVADVQVFGLQAKNTFSNPVRFSNICKRVKVFGLHSVVSGDGVLVEATADDCLVAGHVESANNYAMTTSGTGLVVPEFRSVNPAAGTGGIRQLAGDTWLGAHSHYNAARTVPIAIVGGSVYGPGGVRNNSGTNWAQIDSTKHVVFSESGATTVTNNALHTLHIPTSRPGKAFLAPTTNTEAHIDFHNPNGLVGRISTNGTATTYATSSDYRLKTNAQAVNGAAALATVRSWPIKSFTWKSTGANEIGALAHELQAVKPGAVVGEKDGDNMQGVDWSKCVPELIAAVQYMAGKIEAAGIDL